MLQSFSKATKHSLLAIALLCLCAIAIVARATDGTKTPGRPIKVVSEAWAGYANQQGTGFYQRLLNLIYQPLGYQIDYKILPYARTAAMVAKGEEADIMLVGWDVAHWVYDWKYSVLTPHKAVDTEEVLALSLRHKGLDWFHLVGGMRYRFGWRNGYAYEEHFKVKNQHITLLDNAGQGLKMLQAGRLDFFLESAEDVNQELLQRDDGDRFKRQVIRVRKLYPVFHKGDWGRQLMDIYDSRMQSMENSGELQRWYSENNKNYQDILRVEL